MQTIWYVKTNAITLKGLQFNKIGEPMLLAPCVRGLDPDFNRHLSTLLRLQDSMRCNKDWRGTVAMQSLISMSR